MGLQQRQLHPQQFGYLKFQNHIGDAVLGNAGVYDPAGSIPVDIRIGPAGVVARFGPSRLAPQATFQSNKEIKYDGTKVQGSHILRYGVAFNKILGGGFASFYGLAPELRPSNSPAAQALAAAGPYPGGSGNPLNGHRENMPVEITPGPPLLPISCEHCAGNSS